MSEPERDDPGGAGLYGWWHRNLVRVHNALLRPTVKQTEARARYFHTLSAAALIGGTTLAFTEGQMTLYLLARVAVAFALAVALFVAGALALEDAKYGLAACHIGLDWVRSHCGFSLD